MRASQLRPPSSGHFDPENHSIALARLVPWELAEKCTTPDWAKIPRELDRTLADGATATARQGAARAADRETVAAIEENPLPGVLLGYAELTQDRRFDASLMVDFRKRFGDEGISGLVERITIASLQKTEQAAGEPANNDSKPRPFDDAQERSAMAWRK